MTTNEENNPSTNNYNNDSNNTSNNNPLTTAQNQLKNVIETEIELGIMVHDYQATAEGKEGLMNRVNVLVDEFQKLNSCAGPLHDYKIPIDVIGYIEEGRNPDVYTREFAELTKKQNQFIKGKMHAMEQFQSALASEIKQMYPDMSDSVDDIVKRTS